MKAKREKRIECYHCLAKKFAVNFPDDQIGVTNPICKLCTDVIKNDANNTYGLKVDYVKRICLNCNAGFMSKNNYRLCETCRKITYYV